MKNAIVSAALISAVAAFPALFDPEVAEAAAAQLARRANLNLTQDPLGISKAQTNCGPLPCLTFNEKDQFVSTSGPNAYRAPAADEIRGPCPGLNAAANHGYLPRSGIASIEETISGLGAAYNLGPRVTAALAAYAVALDGNVVQGVWSIGGPLPPDYLVSNLLGTGQGLSYSHNNYEGDASIGRNDIYPSGDAHSLNITKFEAVYALGGPEDRYTLDKFRQRFEGVQDEAIANNPYYFTGAFSTVVVVPAAYNFVINLMSNHSAAEPSGYLDGFNFKSFFGVTGEPGSFVWQKGQERIPDDWYRRPTIQPYEAEDVAGDVAIGYAAYPRTLKFGGNTNGPNTFVGLNIANITGGVLNAANLFQGDNFQCFAFVLAQQAIPAFLKGPLSAINNAQSLLNKYLGPILGQLNCPELGKLDQGLFNSYPGRTYSPRGPATNY